MRVCVCVCVCVCVYVCLRVCAHLLAYEQLPYHDGVGEVDASAEAVELSAGAAVVWHRT